jgi:hypothetical protein
LVLHIKSHTGEKGLGSLLNEQADHYTTKAQNVLHHILTAPIPTFFIDDYAFYCDSDGWVEMNIRVFTDYLFAKQTAMTLSHAYHYRMATWLYDPRSHPTFPYMKALSAYSAMVQLYACSGQLPTASNMKQKKQTVDNTCRYGCKVTEDMYHVFVNCGRFKALRAKAMGVIVRRVERKAEESNLQGSHVLGLLEAAKSFFGDERVRGTSSGEQVGVYRGKWCGIPMGNPIYLWKVSTESEVADTRGSTATGALL